MKYIIPLLLTTIPLTSVADDYQIFGGIHAGISTEKNKDLDFDLNDGYVGLAGSTSTKLFDLGYSLEAHYSKDKTGTSEDAEKSKLRLREALLVFKKEGVGNIVFGNGKTGVYRDIYSHVDIFNKNNMSNKSKVTLFHPTYWGTQTISIGSESYYGFSGNVVATTSNTDKNKGETFDVYHLRLKYRNDDIYVGLNRQAVSNEMINREKDNVIYTATVSYDFDDLTVSALFENNIDSMDMVNNQFTDSYVYGATVNYSIDDFDIKVGGQIKDYKDNYDSESIYQVGVDYHLSKNVDLYTEISVIDSDSITNSATINTDSNVMLGLIAKF